MAREHLEILHGEIFDRNVEYKVIDKCDTLIGILKEIKIKREDMDAIIDVKKLILVSSVCDTSITEVSQHVVHNVFLLTGRRPSSHYARVLENFT